MKDQIFKPEVRQAIQLKDKEAFDLWLSTFESTLDEEKDIEKVRRFRTYITKNWSRIFDWRKEVQGAPADARGLGAMESNQRRITFRMKKEACIGAKRAVRPWLK